jgi:hypothetical protein
MPTHSHAGASNFSFDKEQVLKHVLIVHLSFLAYKCDACVQFYAFDEPQTKQHAALVHHCVGGGGGGEAVVKNSELSTNTDTTTTTPTTPNTSNTSCHFKLIKTEEEINLAINRAQQFITKIQAASPQTVVKTRQALAAAAATASSHSQAITTITTAASATTIASTNR